MDDHIGLCLKEIIYYFRVLIWSYIKLRNALTGWENGAKVITLLVVCRCLMLMLICMFICWFSLTLLNPFFFPVELNFEWYWQRFSMNVGLTKKVLQSTISESEAEKQVCSNFTIPCDCNELFFRGNLHSIMLNSNNIIIYLFSFLFLKNVW